MSAVLLLVGILVHESVPPALPPSILSAEFGVQRCEQSTDVRTDRIWINDTMPSDQYNA
jgi:hypothetical protein